MELVYTFSFAVLSVIAIMWITIVFLNYKEKQNLYKKLLELNDCPFKYSLDEGYLIFDLFHAKLYCSYRFGIQSNGTFGIRDLIVQGLNDGYGSTIELEFGQSIYPIIIKIKEFDAWSNTKSFPVSWDNNFKFTWNQMLNNLSNLDYLEQKYDNEK